MGTLDKWRDSALCAEIGPEPFFGGKGFSSKRARSICAKCEVTAECLDYALTAPLVAGEPIKGVWGGTTELDRRAMRSGRAAS